MWIFQYTRTCSLTPLCPALRGIWLLCVLHSAHRWVWLQGKSCTLLSMTPRCPHRWEGLWGILHTAEHDSEVSCKPLGMTPGNPAHRWAVSMTPGKPANHWAWLRGILPTAEQWAWLQGILHTSMTLRYLAHCRVFWGIWLICKPQSLTLRCPAHRGFRFSGVKLTAEFFGLILKCLAHHGVWLCGVLSTGLFGSRFSRNWSWRREILQHKSKLRFPKIESIGKVGLSKNLACGQQWAKIVEPPCALGWDKSYEPGLILQSSHPTEHAQVFACVYPVPRSSLLLISEEHKIWRDCHFTVIFAA